MTDFGCPAACTVRVWFVFSRSSIPNTGRLYMVLEKVAEVELNPCGWTTPSSINMRLVVIVIFAADMLSLPKRMLKTYTATPKNLN